MWLPLWLGSERMYTRRAGAGPSTTSTRRRAVFAGGGAAARRGTTDSGTGAGGRCFTQPVNEHAASDVTAATSTVCCALRGNRSNVKADPLMSFMRRCSLILMLLGCASCMVRVPTPVGLKVSLNATVRTQVRVEAPRPPEPAVALRGAPVVEFFGIPLEGTADVVFVLDCSGSMSEN